MTAGRSLQSVAWLLTLVVGVGIGTAIGQQSPPKDNKGLAAKVASTVDLAPNMPGYQLRLRLGSERSRSSLPAWSAFIATRIGRRSSTSWKGY